MTFEDIHILNPRVSAIENWNNVLAMRKIRYDGAVPFYRTSEKEYYSMIALLDSSINFTGEGAATALSTPGFVTMRRVEVSGFSTVLDDTSEENFDLQADGDGKLSVSSHHQGPSYSGDEKTPEGLNLPIEDIPVFAEPEGGVWTNGGRTDESLQAAIDSGAEHIFIPALGTTNLKKTVIIRNKVKIIRGMHGDIQGPYDGTPAFIFDEGEPDTVFLEHLVIGSQVMHPSSRTLVIRHCDLGGLSGIVLPEGTPDSVREKLKFTYVASGSGKTHVVDVIGRNYNIGAKHKLWARQLNAEFGNVPLLTNRGDTWVLGFKMESSPAVADKGITGTPALNNLGGNFELFGGLLYTLGNEASNAPTIPAFTNMKGNIAINYRRNGKAVTNYKDILFTGEGENATKITDKGILGRGAAILTDSR